MKSMNDRLKNTLLVLVFGGGFLAIATLVGPFDAVGLYLGLFVVAAIWLLLRGIWRGLQR
jgi:hypothetical protein